MIELWQALPEDIRTTLLTAAGVGGCLLGLYLVGRLLTLRRRDSLLPMAFVLAGVVVLAGGVSLYLDGQPTIPGVVEGKAERIDVDDEGAWSHELTVRVHYTRPDTGETRTDDLVADADVYDRLSPGDRVEVRFLHVSGLFSFARLSDRSTLSMLLGVGANPTFYIVVVASLVLGLLWLLSTRNASRTVFSLVFLLLVALVLVMLFAPQWRAARPLRGRQATATATVRDVDRFTQVGGGEESEPHGLLQPFDLVQVEFVPPDWTGPVVTADIVDANSLALEPGGMVTVHYLLAHPRTIRLEGGTRSYAWKNTAWWAASIALIFLVIAAVMVGSRVFRRVRPRPAPQ